MRIRENIKENSTRMVKSGILGSPLSPSHSAAFHRYSQMSPKGHTRSIDMGTLQRWLDGLASIKTEHWLWLE